MTLGAVNPGEMVHADVRSRRFYAIVIAHSKRELEVQPIDRRVTHHRVKASEVIGLWRRSRAASARHVEGIGRAA